MKNADFKAARRSGGFSLIELMVVMLIVGIIAAIAYPSYRNYVIKSHRADAKTALSDFAQRLERCYTQYNAYDDANCKAHNAISSGNSVTSDEGYYKITGKFAASDQYILTATPTTYGGQNQDTGCSTLTLDQTGTKGSTGGATDCW
ncbi:MAG TPA: type IV pilin protein [Gammaproteobacteria bacterium]|nr:type IV pilin protein [Gammaproteobacteria bacterium]